MDYDDIDAYGDHIVRNNVIRRCGQAGIAGQKGATRCLIAGNLIEDTNYRKEFGGWETAAIKFHNSVDTVIRGNLIRGVYHQMQGAFGIWMDFGNQGTRITRQHHLQHAGGHHLPGDEPRPDPGRQQRPDRRRVRSNSEDTVFAHNLFVDLRATTTTSDINRRSQYFTPHTTTRVGRKTGVPENDKWFNNIFVRTGLAEVKKAPGFAADYNVFLEGASQVRFGDQQSVDDPFAAAIEVEDQSTGTTIRFQMNRSALQLQRAGIDAKDFGPFPTVSQALEDRDGNPIQVDTDLRGNARTRNVVGPLADLRSGENTVRWELKRK